MIPQGRCQGGPGAMHCPPSSIEWIFTEKNWLWDAWPALFNKVTLFSLSEVFCGPQICQKNMEF